jgi:hypothetical protein
MLRARPVKGTGGGKSSELLLSSLDVSPVFGGKGSRVQEFGAGGVLTLRAQWRGPRSGSLKAEHQRSGC